MAISKVVYDGNTLIDLTSDSVNASNLSKGTTAHNAAGEQIVGTFEQAQSDWNQNDETAVDYVKNRPFYTKNPVETILVEESTLSFTEAHDGIYGVEAPPVFLATVGDTYTIYWDSISYECIGVNFMGYPVLGNLSIAFGGSDTGEPFVVMMSNEYMVIYTSDTTASHTFSISKVLQEIVKIDTKYLPFMPKPDGESYLTFKSQNSFKIGAHENTKSWNGTLEYFSSDNTWTVWDGTNYLSAVTNGAEYVLYLRGTGNTVITGGQNPFKFLGSDIACIGNIETLLDYVTVEAGEHPTMANNCYRYLFGFCTGLTQAPELPATALTQACYASMFYGCTSLTQAPALPATTLAYGCYSDMFHGCTGLAQAPKLPATTIAEYCYAAMFYGCTSLIQATELPATTLARSCYQGMFADCTSLTQIPELPATTMEVQCYDAMFNGCTSLKLSETKTEEYIQEYRIPSSGDGTTLSNALTSMFNSTGGTFAGTPKINTTYYLSSDNMIVRGTEIATLNGYVQNMIDDAKVAPLIGTTNELTTTQVYDAVSSGIPVRVQYTDNTYGLLSFTAFNIAESLKVIVSQTIVYYNGNYILAELFGNVIQGGGWGFKSTMLAELTGLDSLDVRVNKLEGAGYLTLETLPKYGGETE